MSEAGITTTAVQGEVIRAGLLERSAVLQLPTGAGKTFLARIAIGNTVRKRFKAVYLCPIRALARELFEQWRTAFDDASVGVYTGESGLDALEDIPAPADADVLIATPEKMDMFVRSWRDHLGWLAKIDLVVADELHTLGGDRRGATLEGLLTRLRVLNPYTRTLGLSATLGNGAALAQWMGGEFFRSDERPVPLAWRIRTFSGGDGEGSKEAVVVDEVLDTRRQGGQVVVFVQSRPRAESIARAIAAAGVPCMPHHAGLSKASRDGAERQFRSGAVAAIVATPTLAVGVNLPARKVVLADLQRYDGGGFADLTTTEIWQLAGRAGRRGLDQSGEAVLIAPRWNQKPARRYLLGQFEPVVSALEGEPRRLNEQVLVAVGSRIAQRKVQVARLISKTFFGSTSSPEALRPRCERAIEAMLAAKMLEQCEDGVLRPTSLGRIAVRFQLSPETVLAWAALEAGLPEATLFDLLLVACSSTDFNARPRAEFEELAALQVAIDSEPMALRKAGGDARRTMLAGTRGRDLAAAAKAAIGLRAWTRLGDMEEAGAVAKLHAHEVEEARKEALRLLQGLAALLGAKTEEVAGERPGGDLLQRVRALSAMVCAGMDDEAATLALVDGIGPVLARRLRTGGIEDIEALALCDVEDVARVDGVSRKRAETWIKAAGGLVKEGGALRFKEMSAPIQVLPEGRGMRDANLDYFRWERARQLDVEPSSSGGWRVTGGAEPHIVQQQAHGYTCDCADAAKGRLCKHVIAVRAARKDAFVPALDGPFATEADGGLNLEQEWMGAQRVAANY